MNQTVEFLLPFTKKNYVDSSADISLLKTKFITHNVSLLPIIDNKGFKNVGLYRRKVMWSKYANEIKYINLRNSFSFSFIQPQLYEKRSSIRIVADFHELTFRLNTDLFYYYQLLF